MCPGTSCISKKIAGDGCSVEGAALGQEQLSVQGLECDWPGLVLPPSAVVGAAKGVWGEHRVRGILGRYVGG